MIIGDSITTMFILRAEDSFAARVFPSKAREDNDKIMAANESSVQKMNIITIITHFQVYTLSQFLWSKRGMSILVI